MPGNSTAEHAANLLLQALERFHDPELVGSVLVIYVIHTVGKTMNIAHLFLNGLKVIIAPTEDAMAKLRPDSKQRSEILRQKDREGKDPDAYDKMNALELVRLEISKGTLGSLMYFDYFDAMVTWSLIALSNFVISEGSRCVLPTKRPIGWAMLTLVAALARAMWCNVQLVGLLGWDNDHGKFAVFCGFCGLFLAAGCAAMSPPGFFFFDLRDVASELYEWGGYVAAVIGYGGDGPGLSDDDEDIQTGLNKEDFTALFLPATALIAAGITAAAALPSIRFAQFYHRALRSGSGASLHHRALLIADLIMPWITVLVWIRSVVALPRFGELGESVAATLSARVWVTTATVAVRLAVARQQLQMFLDGAKEAVLQELREKKVNVYAVRTKFEARFQYLVIAAAQYAAPALTVLLSLALLLHTNKGINTTIASNINSPNNNIVSTVASRCYNGVGSQAVGDCSVLGSSLGICDAARRIVGARPWEEVVAKHAASSNQMGGGGDVLAGVGGNGGGGVPSSGPALPKSEGHGDWVSSDDVGEGRVSTKGGDAGVDSVQDSGGVEYVRGIATGLVNVPNLPETVWSGVMGFVVWWACLSWAVCYAIGVVFWRLFPEEEAVDERARRDRTTKAKRDKDSRGKGKVKARGGSSGRGGA